MITKIEPVYPPMVLLNPRPIPESPDIPEGKVEIDGKTYLILEQVIKWYQEYLIKMEEALRRCESDKKLVRDFINSSKADDKSRQEAETDSEPEQ